MIPYGHVERDLCAKASDDASASVLRVMKLCTTKEQAMLVAQRSAMALLAIAAGATKAVFPSMENASDFDIGRAILNILEGERTTPAPDKEDLT